ncbi:Os06g0180666 [Oryza sativa Japonica Group]|uniref:Os06g0180666 protein n=1 Tax=Oryza sativa subsp. japonica TaxID=39947 RepID=A0A0P0WTM6_ORYSJ|nr:hypothetical protein EE612_032278 [Oryza sativa]BAS96464.1 Os06g0180666 [Oryza sativa Japonica Group]
MGQDVAGGELVQAHGALRLLRRVPPQPAPPHQPPHHPFPRVHLPLHPHRRRRRRSPAPSAAAGGASVQLDASRAVMPAETSSVNLLMTDSLWLLSFWSSRSFASRALLSSDHPWMSSITLLLCCKSQSPNQFISSINQSNRTNQSFDQSVVHTLPE